MVSLVLALLALLLGAVKVANMLAPVETAPDAQTRLRQQRKELAHKVVESRRRCGELENWIDDVRRLQERIHAVGADLYRSRLERLGSGVQLLERQLQLEKELLREYARADELLEVESETLRVMGQLEEGVLDGIAHRLEELESVREANHDLALLLEATEEVEALLRGAEKQDLRLS